MNGVNGVPSDEPRFNVTGTDAWITWPQAERLVVLSAENPGSTWHVNTCGCCVCFHPGGDTAHGWIIGADGEADYV